MTESELTQLLSEAFPGAQVSVALEGLRPVARQQRVYAPLSGLIADGTLHAVNITAQTP